jgi:hypothetical protein
MHWSDDALGLACSHSPMVGYVQLSSPVPFLRQNGAVPPWATATCGTIDSIISTAEARSVLMEMTSFFWSASTLNPDQRFAFRLMGIRVISQTCR